MSKKTKLKKRSSGYWIYTLIGVPILIVGLKIIKKNHIPAGASMYEVVGVDISKHSGIIDWTVLKSQGIQFAFIKSTEGQNYKDPFYKQNYAGAKKNDILVGAYHFFRFNKDGRLQAQHFLNETNHQRGDLIPVVDVEYHGNILSLKSDKDVICEIEEFLNVVESELNVKPIIYTNKEAYLRLVKGHFQGYRLWLSDLNQEPKFSDNGWDFWQYTHKGRIKGANYLIDFNVFKGSFFELKSNYALK